MDKRQKRFTEIDTLSPQLKEVVHEWGYSLVKDFMNCGTKNPKHIRHLIVRVIQETRTGGGSVQTADRG